MAADGGDAGGDADGAGAGDSVREHREEEVGRELVVHGVLRVRGGAAVLGGVGVQDVVRGEAHPDLGQGRHHAQLQVPARAGHAARQRHRRRRRRDALLPHGHPGLLPVRLRGHHARPPRRLRPRPHELPRLDALRPPLAHLLLHRRRLLPLGRRLPLAVGRHRLGRRLCHPPLLWRRRLHRRLLGWAEVDEGPGEVSAQQRFADVGGRGVAVDGMGGVQRRGGGGVQSDRFPCSYQHEHLRRDQLVGVDGLGCVGVRKAVRDWCSPRHDHGPGRHHSRCRVGARVGGDLDGHVCGLGAVVHDDGAAQAVEAAAEGGRHAGSVPHARGGRVPGGGSVRVLRGADAVQLLPARAGFARGVLRRRGREAAGQAAGGLALRHRVERGGDEPRPRRHRARHPAPHERRAPPHRRRRRARRGSVRALGRRREVRHVQARRHLRGHHQPRHGQAKPQRHSLNPHFTKKNKHTEKPNSTPGHWTRCLVRSRVCRPTVILPPFASGA